MSGDFDLGKFVGSFPVLAESHGGTKQLRKLVLALALLGRTVPQDKRDSSAEQALQDALADRQWRIEERLAKPKVDPKIEALVGVVPVPTGWVECRLDDVAQLINGRAYAQDELLSAGTPVIRIQNLNGGKDWYYSDLTLPARQYCDNGDLLFAWSASFGPYVWAGDKSIYHYHIWKLNLSKAIDKRFLYFSLLHITDVVREQSHGLAMLHMTKGQMERWPILLPPLAEQKRIVAKVDELMRLIDDLEAKQTKKREVQTRFRTSALDALTRAEGAEELAAAWKRVAGNFGVLFEREQSVGALRTHILEMAMRGRMSAAHPSDGSVDELIRQLAVDTKSSGRAVGATDDVPYEIPTRWRWVCWGQLTRGTSSGWSPQCESRQRVGDEWGVLKVSAVSWYIFKPEENKALPIGVAPRPEFAVRSGDFLMSRANTSELVGRSVVVGDAPARLLLSDKLVRVDLSPLVDSQYVNLYNRTAAARAHYMRNASGTSDSMKNISREVILTMPIPLPPLAEQKRIVAKVESLMKLCDDLEARLRAKETTAAKLVEAVVRDLSA